jgi:hypothetical protein
MGAMDSVAVGGRCPFGVNRCALRSNNRLPPRLWIVNRNRSGLREQPNVTAITQTHPEIRHTQSS